MSKKQRGVLKIENIINVIARIIYKINIYGYRLIQHNSANH